MFLTLHTKIKGQAVTRQIWMHYALVWRLDNSKKRDSYKHQLLKKQQ